MEKLFIEKVKKLHDEGEFQKALKDCEEFASKNIENVEVYEEIGDNYLSLKKYDKAIKAFKQALKLDKNSASANYLLGFVYSCTDEWGESIKYLEIANKVFPNNWKILRCLGWSLYFSGIKSKGIILLEISGHY